MTAALTSYAPSRGILLHCKTADALAAANRSFSAQLQRLGLQSHVESTATSATQAKFEQGFKLRAELAEQWAPGLDTTGLTQRLGLDTSLRADDLEREILLAMLLSPVGFEFPSHVELASAVRIRRNMVVAARKTALAFHTTEAERPEDCWVYAEGRGFTVRPGHALIPALQKATQPEASGKLYSFSCYRATEYVILLAIAQELEHSNPSLLQNLQQQWESRAIMSGQFHDVFLREYGSMEAPLPPKYYVPGDRLWFRNPDAHSSDVTGYEGSWVFYLGGGLFTNFWKRDQPYTLASKCLELFHWRHATYTDDTGELQINESIVEERVKASMADPVQAAEILALMLRLREPKGVYLSGGCIDTSREYPRGVCPGTTDLVLPLG
ncbi:hypothetical protein SAMN05216344_10823 [Polaromonas sp. OV174]|uniref:hypothetical protein n=1 Tax=Polaromonas sp. OV174 TaxID=1855300 RepID=UPI0008EE268E|nr:hypothetical protein [Polaromonas sp. OV174]SFC05557.1 hypothetical protein SAMN05216344_10823 [Polaromonas sp. OV174]